MGFATYLNLRISCEVILTPTITLLLVCYSQPIFAQDEIKKPTIQELQREIKQRDTVIDDLVRRVKQLEYRVGSPTTVSKDKPQKSDLQKSKTETSQQSQVKDSKKQAKSAAPGAFDVDEKSAERALERTLTAEGALLLSAWSVEVEPSFSYSRSDSKNSKLVEETNNKGEQFFGVRNDVDRLNDFNFALEARIGLPFDSQIEFNLPYRILERIAIEPVGPDDLNKRENTAWVLGDFSIGIAKTLLREKDWWPDLVGRITWDSDTGQTEKRGISLVDGFHEFRGSLTAIKRLDPLAFFGTGFYERPLEKNDFKPGDQYGFSLGVSLATSPETALSAALQQSFYREDRINGRDLPGSDSVVSSLSFGASWIVGRGSLLSVSPSIGLTDDAPDYTARVSWSYRLR